MLPAKERNSQKAFTLVERLIYIGIFSVVAGLVLGILNSTIRSNQAEVANNEVTTQLNTVLTDIQTQVSQSSNIGVYPDFSSINTPTSTGSFLKLRMSSTSTDPTCIYLSSSTVYMAQGPDPSNASQCNQANATALTTSQVLAQNLTFTLITVPGGRSSVSVTIQLIYNSPNPAFAISKTLQSSIGRIAATTYANNIIPSVDDTIDIGQIAPNLRWRNGNFAGTITLGTGTSGGSLGIGTETPSGYFDIASSTATVFIVSNNGNVGINNASPSATLDVNEGSGNNLGLALRSNGAGWGSGLQLVNTSTTGRSYGIYAGADGNLHFADVASSSDRMIISSAGNVGIGTVPSASLDVVNSTAADQTPIVIFGDGSNSNRYQFLADRGSGAVFYMDSATSSIRSNGDLRLEINNSTNPSIYITSGGSIGIGTWTPDTILTVAGEVHVIAGSSNSLFSYNDSTQGLCSGTCWNISGTVTSTGTYLELGDNTNSFKSISSVSTFSYPTQAGQQLTLTFDGILPSTTLSYVGFGVGNIWFTNHWETGKTAVSVCGRVVDTGASGACATASNSTWEDLSSSYAGVEHVFKIVITNTTATFYIDGTQVGPAMSYSASGSINISGAAYDANTYLELKTVSLVQSTGGGIEFPDGTIQTTAN